MANLSKAKRANFTVPSAKRQIAFHSLLVAARKTWLHDALSDAVSRVDPRTLRDQILELVPAPAQQVLAAAGIRDERVFPTPVILEAGPALVGYFRLLLGVPQKWFYAAPTGLGMFKSMERAGLLRDRQRNLLPAFCRSMSSPITELVLSLTPSITLRDISELPLLTLGSQFQGANNNRIGSDAIAAVFIAIREIVGEHIVKQSSRELVVKNASEREVSIAIASDPDLAINENFNGEWHPKVAIEIKGGADASNVHNRAGEAEKSHQKAKAAGYRDFWTVISKPGARLSSLRRESPTTNFWFDIGEILARQGIAWTSFCTRLAGQIGIPVPLRS